MYIDSSADAESVVDSQKEDNAADFTIKNSGDQNWKIGTFYTVSPARKLFLNLPLPAQLFLRSGATRNKGRRICRSLTMYMR